MTAIITMLVLLGLMQLYGLLIMLGMSKTVDSTRSDVATIVDTFVPQENSYHGEVNMVKRETDIVGITEGQYGFSPRYNESFVAIKTIDDKVLKDVIEYSRKNKFAFHSETSCEGENIRDRISININKQRRGK